MENGLQEPRAYVQPVSNLNVINFTFVTAQAQFTLSAVEHLQAS